MTTYLPDLFFTRRGLHTRPAAPALGCPTDEQLAGFAGALLPAHDRQALVAHLLGCADCHDVVRVLADAGALVPPKPSHVPVRRLVARLARRGLELLELADGLAASVLEGARELAAPPPVPVPALGALRGAGPSAAPVSLPGPGRGLDSLELQAQADETARVVVRASRPDDLAPEDRLALVLEVGGVLRERRPFLGEPVVFAPIGVGLHRVRLVARARGGAPRELSRAEIELRG